MSNISGKELQLERIKLAAGQEDLEVSVANVRRLLEARREAAQAILETRKRVAPYVSSDSNVDAVALQYFEYLNEQIRKVLGVESMSVDE